MRLKDKIAVVTGSGRGIGKGCAVELAKHGAEVFLNDRPGSPDLEQTVAEIRADGGQCHAIEADIFSRQSCEALVEQVINERGRIDILVSNPAFSQRGRFVDYPPELFERTLQGTLTSGFHMSQLVSQHMIDRGAGGKILFISSVHAVMPIAESVAYNAAKAGLDHLARTIAVELAEYGIQVNVIEPGWIDTPGEHSTFSEETLTAEAQKLPLKRLGLPSDIGKAAVFLASDEADYVTGATLPVDGLFRFKHCISKETPTTKVKRP